MKNSTDTHRYEFDVYVREVGGNSDLLPLVYLHGLGDSGSSFSDIVQLLSLESKMLRRRQLIPDLPGCGRSQGARLIDSPHTLSRMADRIANLLMKRGEERVILIGHSMGGVLALHLAEQHPSLVAGLIDIEGNKTVDDCTFSNLPGNQTREEFVTTGFNEMLSRILREDVPMMGCPGYEDTAYQRYIQNLRQCNPAAFYDNAKELRELSCQGVLAARLGALSCPKSFIYGFPGGSGVRTLNLIELEGIQTNEVHRAGHWPFIDQPKMCKWAVLHAIYYFSKISPG
jgi:pimeloyl-ACP methyl ester carboxylesterase